MKSRISILGVPVDAVCADDLPAVFEELLESDKVNQVVLVTWADIMRARWDKRFRECLNEAALVVPVSPGLIWGAKFLKQQVPDRFMPFDFVIKLLGHLESKKKSLYLLGCKPSYLTVAEQNLRETFPGLNFVGRYPGHFAHEIEENIILAIRKASPSLMLAGRGVRGHDLWIMANKKSFNSGIFLSEPETMDIFSGRKKRGSRKLYAKGLDFIPRLLKNPLRIFRGLLYIYFMLLLLIYRIRFSR